MDDSSRSRHKEFSEIMKQITWIGQLGLSLIMPLLLCILGCVLLCDRCGVGGWVYIPGFIFGLGAGFMTAYKFYKSETQKASSDEASTPKGFNRHI